MIWVYLLFVNFDLLMINLILFGKPGSGKGTQAEFVKKKYDLIHISTGDVFRYNISKQTELGILAKSYMEKGELVPDGVTIQMLEAEVNKKYEVTFGRHVRELAKIRDKAIDKGNLTAAVAAEVQRGRAAGLYVERKEIRTGTLDSLSEIEIKDRIKKLLGDFKPLLEAEDAVVIEG